MIRSVGAVALALACVLSAVTKKGRFVNFFEEKKCTTTENPGYAYVWKEDKHMPTLLWVTIWHSLRLSFYVLKC